MVFTFITAALVAEVCSASPSAGSIYLWAAEAGGPKYGRLFGFIVAWWSTTAWTTFCASNTQSATNYMLSVGVPHEAFCTYNTESLQELTVFDVDFPKDVSDVKFRAVQWIVTEILLALAALLNFMPRTLTFFPHQQGTSNVHSQILPIRFLVLVSSCHARLFP